MKILLRTGDRLIFSGVTLEKELSASYTLNWAISLVHWYGLLSLPSMHGFCFIDCFMIKLNAFNRFLTMMASRFNHLAVAVLLTTCLLHPVATSDQTFKETQSLEVLFLSLIWSWPSNLKDFLIPKKPRYFPDLAFIYKPKTSYSLITCTIFEMATLSHGTSLLPWISAEQCLQT